MTFTNKEKLVCKSYKNIKKKYQEVISYQSWTLEVEFLVVSGGNPIPIGSGTGSRFSNEVTSNQYFPVGVICFPGFWLHSQDRVTSRSGKMISNNSEFMSYEAINLIRKEHLFPSSFQEVLNLSVTGKACALGPSLHQLCDVYGGWE